MIQPIWKYDHSVQNGLNTVHSDVIALRHTQVQFPALCRYVPVEHRVYGAGVFVIMPIIAAGGVRLHIRPGVSHFAIAAQMEPLM